MSSRTRVAVVPCAPALLPRYAGLRDPFPDLRAACLAAVRWLVADRRDPVLVLCPATAPATCGETGAQQRGLLLAGHLLAASGHTAGLEHVTLPGAAPVPDLEGRAVLALADGSARRGEQAPGYLDDRAFDFDAGVGGALRTGDVAALRDIDAGLGADLLAEGAPVLRGLAARVAGVHAVEVDYDGDPYGVQYWVVRWSCSGRPD